MTTVWAHSINSAGQRQPLDEHLREVARLAALLASPFGGETLAHAAGLWHDLGKADPEWQRYLLENEAGTRTRGTGPDHKCAGAKVALDSGQQAVALLIHAHHGGLQDRQAFRSWYDRNATLPGVSAALAAVRRSNPGLASELPVDLPPGVLREPLAAEMFLRLAFSALVDADTLDTERHHLAGQPTARGATVSMLELWERFDAYHQAHAATDASVVNDVRAEVYRACRDAADEPTGVFRLTVPTGGGKTRSGMAFALRHAVRHGLRRVVVAVPFTTITEQTAQQYREIFQAGPPGSPVVLEHHSAAIESRGNDEDCSGPGLWQRLAAENWDAPVVVTTTVQLFESLFSNRRSKTRKLHNLARSVIILDEAQSLPAPLLSPILDGLHQLTAHFGATVVLSTATQPAFESVPSFNQVVAREIVPDHSRHFAALRRVTYDWRANSEHDWSEVAGWMRLEKSALAIVNTKRQAIDLLDSLADPDALHLSTLLCGAHRRDVLAEVRARLTAGRPCRVVSTQVVEAGVDIDFPAVFRALGPLDSIIQAAGRCNREGHLTTGRVVVFQPADRTLPSGAYPTGAATTRVLAGNTSFDPHDPDWIRRYFRLLFEGGVDTDAKGIQASRRSLNYPRVAADFRMIDDETEDVVVGYGRPEQQAEVGEILQRLGAGEPGTRLLMRRLQPFLVSLRAREADRLRAEGLIEDVMPGLGLWRGRYEPVRGLVTEDPDYIV